ncbi:hypothetical protein QTP88_028520 [Uroleucon formosanum]
MDTNKCVNAFNNYFYSADEKIAGQIQSDNEMHDRNIKHQRNNSGFFKMSSATSNDNSDIDSKINKMSKKRKESGLNVKVPKIVCTENVLEDKELSESSISPSRDSSHSDSNNTSDLDEEKNEILYKEYKKKIRDIKTQYATLHDMYNRERIQEINDKLAEVRSGTAEEYRIPLQDLEEKKNIRLEVATALRECKLINLQHKYAAEEQAIKQGLENDKEILYDEMKADLDKNLQQLEEARNDVDIDAALWSGRNLRSSGRGRGRKPYGQVKSSKKPVVVSGPCIVYNLKDHEILEDWILIKKSLLTLKRKENAEH